jgi:hypothetical protein
MSSEMLLPISQSTMHHVLVDPNIDIHSREVLNFYKAIST